MGGEGLGARVAWSWIWSICSLSLPCDTTLSSNIRGLFTFNQFSKHGDSNLLAQEPPVTLWPKELEWM